MTRRTLPSPSRQSSIDGGLTPTEGRSNRNMHDDETRTASGHTLAVVGNGPGARCLANEQHDVALHPSSTQHHTHTPGSASDSSTRYPGLGLTHELPSAHRPPSPPPLSPSSSDIDLPADNDDRERLTFAPPLPGASHRHAPSTSRAYDKQGNPREPSVTARVVGAVGRNQTFRTVSKTLRRASTRVGNMVSHDQRVRLSSVDDDDDGDGDDRDGNANDGKGVPMKDLGSTSPMDVSEEALVRPTPEDTGCRLRGKTFGVFGPASKTRRTLDRILRFPWTEPIILALILFNVVVLMVQSAPPLFEPRQEDGYFRHWTDYAIFVLFVIFTVEMFARICVTGLILNPEISIRESLFGPTGLVCFIRKRITRSTALRRVASNRPTVPSWRTHAHPTIPQPKRKATLIPETPFQKAVQRQHALSEAGRPYLRHSWHRVDMVAVLCFWIMFILAATGKEATAHRHVYIFRALSILRIGRLLVVTSGTLTILHSLKRAGPLLIRVSFFLIFAFSMFSIIGVQSFRGSYRRHCVYYTDPFNSSHAISLSSQACGGYLDDNLNQVAYLDLDGTPTAGNGKGYICPMNQVCVTSDTNANQNGNSFDNIFEALRQVVIVASLNTWAPVMYLSMDSDYFASCLYFIVGVIIINFWLINLLTAVVVNTFKDIRAETKHSAFSAKHGMATDDPAWATDTQRKKENRLLYWYQKSEYFWVILILIDVVAKGTRTADATEKHLDHLDNIDLSFTIVFDVEIVLRFLIYMPDYRAFFSSSRNFFDLFLAIACSITQIPAITSAKSYPWLTVFQLLRWYRFILAFPRMKLLISKVFGDFAGMLNMVIFLFLVNLMGALVAVQLFRGDISDDGDDAINWSQIYNAWLGMYQIFSSENWTDPLYTTMEAESGYRQRWIAAVFLCAWFLFSNAVVLQMFIAVINENFAVAEEQKRKRQVEEFIRKTEPKSARVSWIDRLNPYRLVKSNRRAVKVGTLPQNLVLPLKQTVAPDVGNVSEKYVKEESAGNSAMRKLFGRRNDFDSMPIRRFQRHFRHKLGKQEEQGDHDNKDDDDDRGLTDLLPPINAGPSADEHMDELRERRNKQADFITAHPTYDRSLWIFKQSNPIRKFCQACVSPAYGERIFGRRPNPTLRLIVKAVVLASIVASIVVAAIATPSYRKRFFASNGFNRNTWFDLVEVALGAIFVAEALIKIIADGFFFSPNAYLLSLWNVLDFLMLVALLVNITTSLIYIGGLSRLTRALRAIRALRLITLFGRLRDTLHAVLFAGALKILDAAILMILYIIPFAVWGMRIFAGLLYYCNDDNASGMADCIYEYGASPVDNSLTFLAPRSWDNPSFTESSWAFNSFRESILILFENVSLEGWIDVMQSLMNIVGRDLQPQTNASQWNAIYSVLFNLFGGVIILTLFLSVIIENFSSRSGVALLTTEQKYWIDLRKYIKAQTPSQLPKDTPHGGLHGWCYQRATQKHGFWNRGFTLLYYFHIMILMFEDFSDNILTDYQADVIFLVLTVIYAIDLVVRFYGLGFPSFRRNGWNVFDVVVIAGSFATTIPALQAAASGDSISQVTTQLQKLFLVAIALKLVQRIDSLNQLFKASVSSLPAIGNLFLLWAVLFLFYGILFLEVFGLTKLGNNSSSRFQNYYTYRNALVMLAFMSTGEGWNGYMHDYTIEYPRCIDSKDYFLSDCGSPAWAFGLFISWNILSMYIFLNMFTGVVVESFAYVYRLPGGASLDREEMRAFKKVWAQFDTKRTGYICRKDYVKFFSRLSGIFELRIYPPEFSVANLIKSARPSQDAMMSNDPHVIVGPEYAVDTRLLSDKASKINFAEARARRSVFNRLYHEARLSEEPGRGMSFTSMLLMLSHSKLIDDEKALLLNDLLHRREKMERVTDMVNLDRVKGLLRTLYWRRKFLESKEEKRRTLNAEGQGIPAIVLDVPASRVREEDDEQGVLPTTLSPPLDSSFTPIATVTHSGTTDVPGLATPTHLQLQRRTSDASFVSDTRESIDEEVPSEGYINSMATSVWGDMMREAVDEEDE